MRAAAGYCLPEPPGAPPRVPLPPGARPRRFECCESNVGFVTFRCRRGQFLKGQPQAAAQTRPRPALPPASQGPELATRGPREADGRQTVGRRTTKREGPGRIWTAPGLGGGEGSTLFRRAGALKGSRQHTPTPTSAPCPAWPF